MTNPVRLTSLLIALAIVSLAAPARAKGPAPFRVVTPEGDSFEVKGADTRAWWDDLYANADPPDQPFHCCASPAAAARYAGEVWAQWGKRAADVPEPYLVYGGWTGLFYPSHLDAPPYIVMPLAQGGGGRRWPSWRVATARMEEIILSGAAGAGAEPGPVERGTRNELPGKVWPAVVVLLAAGGITLVVRRTRRVGVEA